MRSTSCSRDEARQIRRRPEHRQAGGPAVPRRRLLEKADDAVGEIVLRPNLDAQSCAPAVRCRR